MKIAILHGEVAEDACRDEKDVLVQVDFVSEGLTKLGHEPVAVPVSLNLEDAARTLATLCPAIVFNLVESLVGKGGLIHIVPALLDALKIPYTGAGAETMMLTSNKVLAKKWLSSAGLSTPPWFTTTEGHEDLQIAGPWLIKSVWEHASIGLDEDSVIQEADRGRLLAEMDARRYTLGGACLAEAFIDGREFNLSLLAERKDPQVACPAYAAQSATSHLAFGSGPDDSSGKDHGLPGDSFLMGKGGPNGGPDGCIRSPLTRASGPEVLPPAEIRFDAYPPGKVRVVGYRSKWEEGSFEFSHTPQSFTFPETDAPLLLRLKELALRCWKLFDLQGYARVDFRVDKEGRPWILEVNANPCLSPDAGFLAATLHADLTFEEALERIIGDNKKTYPQIAPFS
jgi:D-alanine-D-alanine ligase